jgi:hypothetical protein
MAKKNAIAIYKQYSDGDIGSIYVFEVSEKEYYKDAIEEIKPTLLTSKDFINEILENNFEDSNWKIENAYFDIRLHLVFSRELDGEKEIEDLEFDVKYTTIYN